MIRVDHAEKTFRTKKVIDDMSFVAAEGSIVGLLGANGAGKTTLLKAMAGLLKLDRGAITIDGKYPGLPARAILTYSPDLDIWYPWMKLSDAMRFLKDVYWDWDDSKAQHLLDFLELSQETVIAEASKGTKAKMRLLLALSRQSKYLLLDEPFSGIDPFTRKLIAQAIVEDFMEEGQTVVISTHEIAEVENILDEIVFIHEGKLLLKGNVETLKSDKNKSLLEIVEEVYDHARL
ncbi:ABC transporter ATP-binding protein [Paenibacillus thalictri]|uniref:ABC transporter ATP-binding protein n=1 Tax=Paenibacillus thalictri TaxID=2527873 RepID=A0A4Q9DTV2_9BACL|nr:ABC transporter ATP-binding protein [Paenibacillus thalictri]TBL80383.1 ABC transporter ATP-binding protein [Paenibacillus thalictri]